MIEGDAVSEMLTDYYGGDVPGAALTPPRDPAKLRAGLARLDALRKSAFSDRGEWYSGLVDFCVTLIHY